LRRTTIAQALGAMAEFAVRKAGTERITLSAAEGRILAHEIVALTDVPPFRRSMVDGYAVIAADVRGASRVNPVHLTRIGDVSMGTLTRLSLRRGQAAAVPTGGALPEGTTGIIKIEDTASEGDRIIVYDGEDCEDRFTDAASDIRLGQLLFEPGAVFSPAAVGLLAASGVADVSVYRRPRVGVVVTGDELVAAGRPLQVGQIYESNGLMVCAALEAMGFSPKQYGPVADEREILAKVFHHALNECDAVIISGGSSVGLRDHAPAVVADAGEPGVIVHGVRAKPGRPVLLAMIGEQPVVGLPGNPVSALIMLETLAKPILLRMFDKVDNPLPIRARLESSINVDAGLEHRIPVQLLRGAESLHARPLLGTSSQLHILAFADAFIVIPEGSGGFEQGTWVDALPFSRTRTLS
jgi:molybdenum cofactor synthesis domain-containing protein